MALQSWHPRLPSHLYCRLFSKYWATVLVLIYVTSFCFVFIVFQYLWRLMSPAATPWLSVLG